MALEEVVGSLSEVVVGLDVLLDSLTAVEAESVICFTMSVRKGEVA